MYTGSFNTKIVITDNWLVEISKIKNKVLIIDSNIRLHYNEMLTPLLINTRFFEFNASESNKNLNEITKILDFFQTENLNRSSYVICIGGGITTDIGAFTASIYKRGCRLILIPTTLLGMVDASIGGKTAINYNGIKNCIGTFYSAEKVIISSVFLNTLPKSEYQTGMVEVVKMSFLHDSRLAEILNQKWDIINLVKEAINTKLSVCEQDVQDRSTRRLLNLGHTFGHVLESISNFEISHGTAVAIGIRIAAKFSYRNGFISESDYKAVNLRLDKFEFPSRFPAKYCHELEINGIGYLKQDKKAGKKIRLVLFNNGMKLFIHETQKFNDLIASIKEFSDG